MRSTFFGGTLSQLPLPEAEAHAKPNQSYPALTPGIFVPNSPRDWPSATNDGRSRVNHRKPPGQREVAREVRQRVGGRPASWNYGFSGPQGPSREGPRPVAGNPGSEAALPARQIPNGHISGSFSLRCDRVAALTCCEDRRSDRVSQSPSAVCVSTSAELLGAAGVSSRLGSCSPS
jgi:hypothetical protein